MKKSQNKNYDIALDIGTNSVGWAVTDKNNDLLKFNGKNMWGTRLFDAGETAVKRRIFRSTRRRLERRRNRVILLQELVGNEVLKEDEAFFLRMKESFLCNEDRNTIGKNNLFYDLNLTDKDYYKQYHTIYHLRKELIKSETKMDIRLIYLALHHIIKYRGNFLYEGQEFGVNNTKVQDDIKEVLDFFIDEMQLDFKNDMEAVKFIEKTIKNKQMSKAIKENEIIEFLNPVKDSKKQLSQFIKAIFGKKVDFSIMFNFEEKQSELNLYLSSEYNEETIQELLQDKFRIFETIKSIYNWVILNEILKGEEYLSFAMVKRYEKHEKDLKIFKRIMKEYFKSEYSNIFRKDDKKTFNYCNYISASKACSKEDFYNSIKKLFNTKEDILKENEDYLYCISSMENNDFLLKQNSTDNVAIPYQLNKLELIKIIENQSKYYNILTEKKEKIIKLLEFRIPYYVGPLNRHSKFAWIEKIDNGEKIYPWNFKDIVDIDKSAENFITRMTNKCTYLLGEDVIPKNSLLYSEYNVLNEVNKISVNGKLLSVDEKNKLIETKFKETKLIKEKALVSWLRVNDIIISEDVKIEGYQKEKEFSSSLTSYIDFTKIFGEINEHNYEMIEEIIRWITLFTEKEILIRKIGNAYHNISKEQIKQIAKLEYTGWSRLSKKLLNEIFVLDKFENKVTIIDQLRKTNKNFMQIINDDELGFNIKIQEECNFIKGDRITLKDINDLNGSPAIKKAVWQTVKIVKEIVKIMRKEPDGLFIEFAREDAAPKRTTSRIDNLIKIYSKIKEESRIFNNEVEKQLLYRKSIKDKLNDKSLFLYFVQNGKCIYSGKALDLGNLSATCEIDHIIPRAYIKDDSIENTVLVLKEENQNKKDKLYISEEIRRRQHDMWEQLYKCGLIGNKKLRNLGRANFDEKDIEGFINRQLVETRQIIKNVASLFKEFYSKSNVVAVKADLCSDFRKQFELYKVRDINDYHHAHDAYITAVIGNYILKRYPKMKAEFSYGEFSKFIKNKAELSKNKFGFIISSFRNDYIDENGEVIWVANSSIAKIKKILNYKDCNITKKLEEETGEFYKQTLRPKKENLILMKENLPTEKYGGYSNGNKAYSVVIEHSNGKKIEKTLVGIQIQKAKIIKGNENKLIEYLEKEMGYKNVKLLKNRILKYQLIKEKDNIFFIASDKEVQNAKQLLVDNKYQKLLYEINNKKEDFKKENVKLIEEFYEYFTDKLFVQYPAFKNISNKLLLNKEKFIELTVEQKIDFVKEILKITQVNAQNANFGKFKINDLTDRTGRMSGKTFKINEIEFVDQSITGLFEKRYKL